MVKLAAGISSTCAPEPACYARRFRLRPRVDDDDLDLLVDLLTQDRLQAAHEVDPSVLDWDDDRDHAGVTAATN